MRRPVQLAVLLPFLLANNSPGPQMPEMDAIVVNAPSRETTALRQQVRNFIANVSDTTGQEQFSRRNDPFCMKIIGIDQSYHAPILDVIRSTAREAGVRKEAPSGCRPNTLIVFSEDADRLVEIIRDENPILFKGQPKERIARIFQSKAPVRWWYGLAVKGAAGEPVIDGTLRRTNSSLISSGLRIDIESTVIIVDIKQADGYPLESISSFIAMVAFAQIDGGKGQGQAATSILSIFNNTGPRIKALRQLTVWDKAYLQALYRMPADRPLWQQRSRLAGAMLDSIRTSQDAP